MRTLCGTILAVAVALLATGEAFALDASGNEPRPSEKKDFPPYASDSFVAGVNEKPTGFFRVVQWPDGRWWAIDPLGRGTVLMGVDHVRYEGHWSQRTKRSVHHEANKRKFPNKADWEEDTLSRLKGWGFNVLGAGCDPALERRGLVHTRFLKLGESLCRDERDDVLWICPDERRPGSAFPNVFDLGFSTHCDRVASAYFVWRSDVHARWRRLHPYDAMFKPQGDAPAGSPDGCWRLAPGAGYEPNGTVWVICIGGTGGYDAWERQIMGAS